MAKQADEVVAPDFDDQVEPQPSIKRRTIDEHEKYENCRVLGGTDRTFPPVCGGVSSYHSRLGGSPCPDPYQHGFAMLPFA